MEGGVMNTVYGPIFPIIGGGEDSRLIAIVGRRKKLREKRGRRAKRETGEKKQRPKSKDSERENTQPEWLTVLCLWEYFFVILYLFFYIYIFYTRKIGMGM